MKIAVDMLEARLRRPPRFEVSRIEAGTARSYSIDTIERLHAVGVDSLAFLIGADAFAEIRTWHRWRDVRRRRFLVVTRPGAGYQIPEGAPRAPARRRRVPISSSEIRAQIVRGNSTCRFPSP